jgi:hypothetical protein
LSGVVYDAASGDPVTDVLLCYGSQTTTTDSEGVFRLGLGSSSGASTEIFWVYRSGYQFLWMARLTVDASRSWEVSIPIRRVDDTTHTARTSLAGRIYRSDGTTEITHGTPLTLGLYGEGGSFNSYEITYAAGSGYLVDTVEDSANCLLVAVVRPAVGNDFVAMADGLDLSGPTATADLIDPGLSGWHEVELSSEGPGAVAGCAFVTPYGLVAGHFLTAAGEVDEEWFFSTATETVSLADPLGWTEVAWVQRFEDTGFAHLPDHRRLYMSSSAATGLGSVAALPTLDLSLGPAGVASASSLDFENGILSVDEVTGASLYTFTVEEPTGAHVLGRAISFGPSAMLPSQIVLGLGASFADVSINLEVGDTRLVSFELSDLSSVGTGRVPLDLSLGIVEGITAPYEASVPVPQAGSVTVGLE